MGATKISWTDFSFNPWFGCSPVSEGCRHCYARDDFSIKLRGIKWGPNEHRVIKAESGWSELLRWNQAAKKAGVRRRVFCGSLCDVFEDRPELEQPRDRLFNLIRQCAHLDFLLLTKRIENVPRFWARAWANVPPDNLWLGVTTENQTAADARIPILLRIPAAVRFVSIEPILEPIDLRILPCSACNHPGNVLQWPCPYCKGRRFEWPEWIIVGGESGPNCRPCDPDWIRSIVRQCKAAGVAVWVKQGSDRQQGTQSNIPDDLWKIKELPERVEFTDGHRVVTSQWSVRRL